MLTGYFNSTISFSIATQLDVVVTIPTNDGGGFAINGAVLTSLLVIRT